MTDIQTTLEERGNRYGTFEANANLCQVLKDIVHAPMDDTFTAVHKEALDMICHKMARIVNGDPNYIDSWHDIAGYATLVVDHLKENQQ
jgi:hypothetical protein